MRHRPVHNGERQNQTSLQDEEPLVHSIVLTHPLLGSSPRGCITGVGVTAALADPVTLARLAILVNEVNQLSLLSDREREREREKMHFKDSRTKHCYKVFIRNLFTLILSGKIERNLNNLLKGLVTLVYINTKPFWYSLTRLQISPKVLG